MVSFIIFSRDSKKGQTYIQQQCSLLAISPFDQITITRDEEKNTQSLGIETIKKSQRKIHLMPGHSQYKAVIIPEGELLTPEAQNALLKILEEPPEHTYIYILTTSREAILSTILSRCSMVTLEENEKKIDEQWLSQIANVSLSHKLAIVEKNSKQRASAQQWLEELMYEMHHRLLSEVRQGNRDTNDLPHLLNALINTQKIYSDIQTTNVNLRLALEQIVLAL